MRNVKIGDRTIGDGQPTYIIAEIGINHNGDVSLAKDMISAAWESKADAVKIQTFITKDFLHPSHPGYQYDIDAEISHDEEQEIWDFAKKAGINLFSTPEELRSLEFIKMQNPKIVKIAAMDFNYKNLVQAAASIQKPILLSSGMSTMEEVLQTVRWVEEANNFDYIVLHCVSNYPAKASACNLRAIETMKKILNCPVGFSDHTVGIHISQTAVALGANVLEKHFTIDKSLPGPDQKCSMSPEDLKQLINSVRDIEAALGDGRKEPAADEIEPRRYKRRGIYAACDLEKGSLLTKEKVVFYAPSNENSKVTDWPIIEGRALNRGVKKLELIQTHDVL